MKIFEENDKKVADCKW